MKQQMVVLVDKDDNDVGVMEKLEAHRTGELHRAFSVFIFDQDNKMLLHKRAEGKYHSSGLWTNACCSHPAPQADLKQAAEQRLIEEMGLRCELRKVFEFTYKADVGNDFIEYEYDHVFMGRCNDSPQPDATEVAEWKWMTLNDLTNEVEANPEHFTAWFRIALPRVLQFLDN